MERPATRRHSRRIAWLVAWCLVVSGPILEIAPVRAARATETAPAIKVAAVGDPTPLGGTYFFVDSDPVASGDQVLFSASVEGGPPRTQPSGFPSTGYGALFSYRGGSVEAVAVSGDPIPALDDPGTPEVDCRLVVDDLAAAASNGTDVVVSTMAAGRTPIGGEPECTLTGGSHPDPKGLFLLGDAGPKPLVMEGDPSPAGSRFDGPAFCGFKDPHMNAAGAVLFLSCLEDGRHGLFLASKAGIAEVAVSGAATPIGGTYGDIRNSDLGDGGEVVFFALTDVGGEGIFAPGRKIVAQGDTAPGVGTVLGFSVDYPVSMNGGGLILFPAFVNGTAEDANFVTTFAGGIAEAKRLPVSDRPVTPLSGGGLVVFEDPFTAAHDRELYRIAADGTATSLGRVPRPGDPSPFGGAYHVIHPRGATAAGAVLVYTVISSGGTLTPVVALLPPI